MRQDFSARNNSDEDCNPTGGWVSGTGINIQWQDGPLGRGDERKRPNGAFVEDVIAAAKQRLEYFQKAAGGRFACEENEDAIQCLVDALVALDGRTARREREGVEGTHQP